MTILEAIRKLPKTDLHYHLDGSIRPQTIMDLALSNNIKIPTNNIEEFKNFVQVGKECSSLKEYLEKFSLPLEIFNDTKGLHRISLEVVEDCFHQGIKYFETRFAPLLNLKEGTRAEEKIESILSGLKDGSEKYKVDSRLILCCMTHETPENSIEVVKLAEKYMNHGVVAVDLAGNEHDFPPEIHKKAFDLAYDKGLNITVHAGETGISENIMKAVKLLHAQRIGHGTSAYKDPKVVEFLIENQIPLEVCMKSNIHTKAVASYEDHPFKNYFKQGVKVTVNTDNTTVSNVTLLEEYERLLELGFSLEEIKMLVINGVEASFAPSEIKKKLLASI